MTEGTHHESTTLSLATRTSRGDYLTFIVFFYGMTMALENTGLYWKSNLVIGIFAFFAYLGWRRSLFFDGQNMVMRYARFWKHESYDLTKISEMIYFPNGIAFSYEGKEVRLLFRKKTFSALKEELAQRYPAEKVRLADEVDG